MQCSECNLVHLIHSIYVQIKLLLFVLVLEFDHMIRKANGISQWASVVSYKNQKFELSGQILIKGNEINFSLS